MTKAFSAASKPPAIAQDAPLAPGLYLVATPIGNLGDITLRALATLRQADLILCEDTRHSGRLLKAFDIRRPLQSYHTFNAAARQAEILDRLRDNARIALISDAGTPLMADPGEELVTACRAAGLPVWTVPGACAAVAALTVAGVPAMPFAFLGFLPPKSAARREFLARFATLPLTLVVYETPHRILAALADIAAVVGNRPVTLARELTKLHEEVLTAPAATLAEILSARERQRGEMVLLIAPAPAEAMTPSETTVEALLREALRAHSVKEAVAQVAAATGLPRRAVYARALALREADTAQDSAL
jgi:16S rRNA (cytidine1402-2'-O)-methyltransferase